MKKIIGFFLFLFLTFSLLSQNESEMDSLSKMFAQQTIIWQNAYNSKDANNLVKLYAPDAQYISSHVSGLVANSRDKLIVNFQNGMNMGGYIESIEVLKTEISCELATLLCKYVAINNGETVIGRNLLVLKNINGRWLIILHMTVV